MSMAFKAIAAAAEAAGATSVAEDGTVSVIVYKGSTIRIAMLMGVVSGWSIEIDGKDVGSKKAPSAAFKAAAKEIDRRLAWATAALEGLHNVAADKGAEIASIEADRVVMTYEGRELVATKPALLWTASCGGEQLAHGAFNAWQVLRHAIGTLDERIQAEADRDNAAIDAAEEVAPEQPRSRLDDFCTEEDLIDDEKELPLTDFDTVRDVLNEAFQNGDVDHTTTVTELREAYDITEAVEDHEVLEALALAVRADYAPVLVLSLGGDRVEVVVEVGHSDDPKDFDRAMAKAVEELSDISGERIVLQRVGDHEEGDGVLRAYRVPQGDYYADDFEEVARFGVEVGRYRMVSDDEHEDALASLRADITTGFAGGAVTGATKVGKLREMYCVASSVSDDEIAAAYGDVIRDVGRDMACLVDLASGAISAARSLSDGRFGLIWQDVLNLQSDVAREAGKRVEFERVMWSEPRSAADYQIFWMPRADYAAGDGANVVRYGYAGPRYRDVARKAVREAA